MVWNLWWKTSMVLKQIYNISNCHSSINQYCYYWKLIKIMSINLVLINVENNKEPVVWYFFWTKHLGLLIPNIYWITLLWMLNHKKLHQFEMILELSRWLKPYKTWLMQHEVLTWYYETLTLSFWTLLYYMILLLNILIKSLIEILLML